jgi:hypothetical protein
VVCEEYQGSYLGKFNTYAHQATGDVYAIDEYTFFIKNFFYDGLGQGIYQLISELIKKIIRRICKTSIEVVRLFQMHISGPALLSGRAILDL